jgi:tetratricopeptide (TPR) repeat protein
MKIYLAIIIVSCTINIFAQKQDINKELLSAEYSVWMSQEDKEVSEIIFFKAQKLTENGLFEEAIKELDRIKNFSSLDSNEIFYKRSLNNFLLKNYDNAYNQMLEIPDSLRLHEKKYLMLWLFTLNELKKWEDCKQQLLAIDDTACLQKTEIEKLPVGIKYKSQVTARRLSGFFPGTGQFYAGYPLKGSASILLHSSFCFIAVESVLSGMYITGVVYGLYPILRFYAGGKSNSYRLAEQHNNKQVLKIKKKYLEKIRLIDK